MRTVKWGILSTARINRRLIPVLHASAHCNVLAVASRDSIRAAEYARTWQIPRAYSDYTSLLEDPDIDVVYISLPNDLHALWTIRALHAGKHVLCEKPLCLSHSEMEQIMRACDDTGRVVMEAFMYIHHPQTAYFRQLIADGAIGELVAMTSEFTSGFSRPQDNYRMSASQGGGVLWDIGVYPVSFFQYINPSPVTGTSAIARMQGDVDMSFSGRLDFDNGVTGQFFVSFESVYSTRTAFIGTMGRLDISHPYNAVHECQAFLTRGEDVERLVLPVADLYAGQVENMHAIALGNGTPVFDLQDSSSVLDAIVMLKSAIA
jgi:D-xylose 1-dehydrogenase (NADP+, D-xylono-1,5-lactone-forming)